MLWFKKKKEKRSTGPPDQFSKINGPESKFIFPGLSCIIVVVYKDFIYNIRVYRSRLPSTSQEYAKHTVQS